MKQLSFTLTILASLLAAPLLERGRAHELNFKPVPAFIQLPDTITLEACTGVGVNRQDEVFLLHRGKQPVICLDAKGKYLRSWGDNVIAMAHGLRIDSDDNVWVTDIENHQVFKFDSEGTILMAWGKAGQAGDAIDEFNKPTDVAFGPQGEVYVSDGYGNNRVVKFTPNGGYLNHWGEAGTGPGQFNTPHSITVDSQGRVVLGDRENDRIQVFDSGGKLLEIWEGFAPFGLAYDNQGHLFVADGRANKVLCLNDRGRVIGSWGSEGAQPGQFQLPHMLTTDSQGNIIVAEILGKRFQKLARRQ